MEFSLRHFDLLWFPRNLYQVLVDVFEASVGPDGVIPGCGVKRFYDEQAGIGIETCFEDSGAVDVAGSVSQVLGLFPPEGMYVLNELFFFEGLGMVSCTILLTLVLKRIPFIGG